MSHCCTNTGYINTQILKEWGCTQHVLSLKLLEVAQQHRWAGGKMEGWRGKRRVDEKDSEFLCQSVSVLWSSWLDDKPVAVHQACHHDELVTHHVPQICIWTHKWTDRYKLYSTRSLLSPLFVLTVCCWMSNSGQEKKIKMIDCALYHLAKDKKREEMDKIYTLHMESSP